MKDVRIGCSGWGHTFYRLVKREAVEGWVERTPPGFLFAVKGSRYLTHMERLRGIEQGLRRFWEPLEPLREGLSVPQLV